MSTNLGETVPPHPPMTSRRVTSRRARAGRRHERGQQSKDHLGSVRLVINAQTGEVAQSIDYDAWGRVLNETGAGFQPFGLAGGLYGADTKLVRFGARDYDPEAGRWTCKDPLESRGGRPVCRSVSRAVVNLWFRELRWLLLQRLVAKGNALRA